MAAKEGAKSLQLLNRQRVKYPFRQYLARHADKVALAQDHAIGFGIAKYIYQQLWPFFRVWIQRSSLIGAPE